MTHEETMYQQDLIRSLQDHCEASAYLNAAIEDGDKSVFLLALHNVAEAHGGVDKLAEKSQLSRENLYHALSQNENPEIKSLYALLHAMGLKLAIEPQVQETEKAE